MLNEILSQFTVDSHIYLWDMIARICMAVVIGFLLGLERELSHHPAGIKTHVLVCLGSALTSLIATEMAYQANAIPASLDLSRIAAGVVSGMGFIGAGAIMKARDGTVVTGITTAATLWVSSGLGLAIGMGYYRMALLSFLAIYAATLLLKLLEKKVLMRKRTRCIEVVFTEKSVSIPILDAYFENKHITVLSLDYLSNPDHKTLTGQKIYRCRYALRIPTGMVFVALVKDIALLDNILEIYEVYPGKDEAMVLFDETKKPSKE